MDQKGRGQHSERDRRHAEESRKPKSQSSRSVPDDPSIPRKGSKPSQLPEADLDDAVQRSLNTRDKAYVAVSKPSRQPYPRVSGFKHLSIQDEKEDDDEKEEEEDEKDDDNDGDSGPRKYRRRGGIDHEPDGEQPKDSSVYASLESKNERARTKKPYPEADSSQPRSKTAAIIAKEDNRYREESNLVPRGTSSRHKESLAAEREVPDVLHDSRQSRNSYDNTSRKEQHATAMKETIFPPRGVPQTKDVAPSISSGPRGSLSNISTFNDPTSYPPPILPTSSVQSSRSRGLSGSKSNVSDVRFSNIPVTSAQSSGPGQSSSNMASAGNVGSTGTAAVPTADSDDDMFPFTVLTDMILQEYVQIPQYELRERLQFLLSNIQLFQRSKESIKIIEHSLFSQAVEFSRMGKSDALSSCCLSLALVQVSKNQHVKTIATFFKALMETDSQEKADLRAAFTKDSDLIREQSRKMGPIKVPKRYRNRPLDETAFTALVGERLEADQKISKDNNAGDPSLSQNPAINQLSPAYKLRDGKWFVVGRVFSVIWHESAGEVDKKKKKKPAKVTDELPEPRHDEKLDPGLSKNYSLALYNSKVFSHIRRFIVIRNRHGYCWCVGIGTYGGRGLAKPGLKEEDINAHTVVFDIEKGAAYLRGEPRSKKRAIGVQMVQGATLDPMSRLHLGKPYNVEWNIRAADCGMVQPSDLEALVSYVRDELFG